MLSTRRWSALLAVFSTTLLAPRAPARAQADEPFPEPAAFMRQVRDAVRLDYELQSDFTYIEQRRDVRISPLGKLGVGPLRTFEVFPAAQPGRTVKRLIAVDGRPLPPEELARRDREHQENVAKRAAREKRESALDRAKRLKEEKEEIAERNAILDDALAVFEPTFKARDVIDGQRVFVIAIAPRPQARVTTREGRWMKKFHGRVWIGEADHQIARLEMQASDDVTIGWGILGRVHKGSRFTFARRWFLGAWLPAEVVFEATGRTLLFRGFDLDLVTTYSGYRRLQ